MPQTVVSVAAKAPIVLLIDMNMSFHRSLVDHWLMTTQPDARRPCVAAVTHRSTPLPQYDGGESGDFFSNPVAVYFKPGAE